ncbi:MAG: sensor histidine kinase [Acutalibacteraceae bacterium]
MKNKLKNSLKLGNKKLAFAVLAIASVAFVIFLFYYMYSANLEFVQPLELDDYTSEASPWSFYKIENGEKQKLTATETESGTVIKSFRPVYCEMELEFVINNAVLDFGRLNTSAVAFLEENLVYANSDFDYGENGIEFQGDLRLSSDDTIVTLPDKYDGKALRIVFLPSDGKVVLPQVKLANIKTIFGQESRNVLDGIFRTSLSLLYTLLMLAIFIAERYKGKMDIAALMLVIYFTLNVIVPINLEYSNVSENMVNILNDYCVGEFILVFATAVMHVFFTFKAKRNTKATLVLVIGYAASLFVSYGVACAIGPAAVTNIISFSYVLFYVLLVIMFIVSIAEWRGGSFFFKYYTIFSGIGIAVILPWSFYSNGASTIMEGDIISFLEITKLSLLQPYLSSCIAIIVTFEFVVNIIHNEMTIHALTMQNQLTQEYLKNLEDTIGTVRKTRHEMRHHIEAMCILAENKYYDRLEEYLNNLSEVNKNSSQLYYSQNKIVSAVISSKLRDAKAKRIETDISVNIPEQLNVNNMALLSFLMNMLENAVEACDRMPQDMRRFIRLKIKIKSGKLIVACANSSNGQLKIEDGSYITSKDESEQHGYGISIMQQCCESVGGSMVIEEQGGTFTVRAVFPLDPN